MPKSEVQRAPPQRLHIGAEDRDQIKGHYRKSSCCDDVLTKHPLQNTWTLWYYKSDRNCSWEENQRKVIDFSTVEDFWALYNHIEEASKLNPGCDYSLFKKGIKPMWEDKENRKGGRWVINLDKKQRGDSNLSSFWQEVMFLLIGEAFGNNSKHVNGAVVNVRYKGDKIGVWLGDCDGSSQAIITEIGKLIKEKLDIKVAILFEYHENNKTKTSSSAKAAFRV